MTVKQSHARVIDVLARGGVLYEPSIGERSWILTDPDDPSFEARVREQTVRELRDLGLLRRGGPSAISWVLDAEAQRMAPNAVSERDEADIRRLGRALRSVHVLETLDELELESGVPTRRIAHLVKKYPEQLARVARAQSIEYSGYAYQPSGAGAFGHYGAGPPAASHPAAVYVKRTKGP